MICEFNYCGAPIDLNNYNTDNAYTPNQTIILHLFLSAALIVQQIRYPNISLEGAPKRETCDYFWSVLYLREA